MDDVLVRPVRTQGRSHPAAEPGQDEGHQRLTNRVAAFPPVRIFRGQYSLAKTDQPVTGVKRIGAGHCCCNIRTLPSPSPGI